MSYATFSSDVDVPDVVRCHGWTMAMLGLPGYLYNQYSTACDAHTDRQNDRME